MLCESCFNHRSAAEITANREEHGAQWCDGCVDRARVATDYGLAGEHAVPAASEPNRLDIKRHADALVGAQKRDTNWLGRALDISYAAYLVSGETLSPCPAVRTGFISTALHEPLALHAFAEGWSDWCRGFSREEAGESWCQPEYRTIAQLGFDAAAYENAQGGGERPRSADASEAAEEWLDHSVGKRTIRAYLRRLEP